MQKKSPTVRGNKDAENETNQKIWNMYLSAQLNATSCTRIKK